MLHYFSDLDVILTIILIMGLIYYCIYFIFNPSYIHHIVNKMMKWTGLLFIIYSITMIIIESLWSYFSMSVSCSTYDFLKEFFIPHIVSLLALIYCLYRIVKPLFIKE